jgi:hypothetical protein
MTQCLTVTSKKNCLLRENVSTLSFWAYSTLPRYEIAVVGHLPWLFTMLSDVLDCGENEVLMSLFLTSEV